MTLEPLLTVRELGAQLGFSKDQIYRLARAKDLQRRLPHRVIGGAFRFVPSEVQAWLQRQPGYQAAPVAPAAPVFSHGAIGRRDRFREGLNE